MKKTGRHPFPVRPVFVFTVLALALLGLAGCTARERAGYSSIPQNTPSSWSQQPYGQIRN